MPVRRWGMRRAWRLAVRSMISPKKRPAEVATKAMEPDGRAYAKRVEPPWRSSLAWDTYDLSASGSPESDWSSWFSFEALAWQPIRVEAEASIPGVGIELRL